MSAAWRMSLADSTCACSVSPPYGLSSRGTPGGSHLGLGRDNLALSNPLALGRHRQGLLELLAEDNILDKHALNLDTPACGDILDNLADALCDLLPTLDHVLQYTGTDDVTQCGLRTLHERLPDIGDSEGGLCHPSLVSSPANSTSLRNV
jgi:hypothetical protein